MCMLYTAYGIGISMQSTMYVLDSAIYCDLQNKWESRIFQRTFPVGFTTSKTFRAVPQFPFILQVAVYLSWYACMSER